MSPGTYGEHPASSAACYTRATTQSGIISSYKIMETSATMKPLSRRLTMKRMLLASVLCIVSYSYYYSSHISNSDKELSEQSRRRLGISVWARDYFHPISTAPHENEKETTLYWHLPKSGGSTAKSIYRCMNLTIASRLDPKVSRINEKELIAFEPYGKRGGSFVNVDMTTRGGIRRAGRMGLVPSGKADILFVMDPAFAGDLLFDRQHKGRILCLFRHPIQRLESKFYYLQKASWEKTYRPDWADISILDWAQNENKENNVMVKKLAGLRFHDTATETELRLAMRIIEKRFVVGLTDSMKESIRRFNIVMNIDLTSQRNRRCMNRFFGHGSLKTNSNTHPKLEPGSPAWEVLAQDNALDIKLYEYILYLFDQQKEVIDSYATSFNELGILH